MDQANDNTHPLQQAATLRLLAAALELQHLTSAAANVVPIPGGERLIAIGTSADVAQLLGAPVSPARQQALTDAQITAGAAVLGDDGKAIGRNTAIMVADAMMGAGQQAAPVVATTDELLSYPAVMQLLAQHGSFEWRTHCSGGAGRRAER